MNNLGWSPLGPSSPPARLAPWARWSRTMIRAASCYAVTHPRPTRAFFLGDRGHGTSSTAVAVELGARSRLSGPNPARRRGRLCRPSARVGSGAKEDGPSPIEHVASDPMVLSPSYRGKGGGQDGGHFVGALVHDVNRIPRFPAQLRSGSSTSTTSEHDRRESFDEDPSIAADRRNLAMRHSFRRGACLLARLDRQHFNLDLAFFFRRQFGKTPPDATRRGPRIHPRLFALTSSPFGSCIVNRISFVAACCNSLPPRPCRSPDVPGVPPAVDRDAKIGGDGHLEVDGVLGIQVGVGLGNKPVMDDASPAWRSGLPLRVQPAGAFRSRTRAIALLGVKLPLFLQGPPAPSAPPGLCLRQNSDV